jgi:DNA-binding CsgD family transcriptional regulator
MREPRQHDWIGVAPRIEASFGPVMRAAIDQADSVARRIASAPPREQGGEAVEDIAHRAYVRTVPDDGSELPLIVANLLRQLIEHLDENPLGDPRETGPTEGQDILLDVCLDGHYYTLARSPEHVKSDGVTLSPRETEIVRLVARGLPTKAIANVLDVSLWTVSTHLRRVFAKLQVNSRAEMVARALAEGLI